MSDKTERPNQWRNPLILGTNWPFLDLEQLKREEEATRQRIENERKRIAERHRIHPHTGDNESNSGNNFKETVLSRANELSETGKQVAQLLVEDLQDLGFFGPEESRLNMRRVYALDKNEGWPPKDFGPEKFFLRLANEAAKKAKGKKDYETGFFEIYFLMSSIEAVSNRIRQEIRKELAEARQADTDRLAKEANERAAENASAESYRQKEKENQEVIRLQIERERTRIYSMSEPRYMPGSDGERIESYYESQAWEYYHSLDKQAQDVVLLLMHELRCHRFFKSFLFKSTFHYIGDRIEDICKWPHSPSCKEEYFLFLAREAIKVRTSAGSNATRQVEPDFFETYFGELFAKAVSRQRAAKELAKKASEAAKEQKAREAAAARLKSEQEAKRELGGLSAGELYEKKNREREAGNAARARSESEKRAADERYREHVEAQRLQGEKNDREQKIRDKKDWVNRLNIERTINDLTKRNRGWKVSYDWDMGYINMSCGTDRPGERYLVTVFFNYYYGGNDPQITSLSIRSASGRTAEVTTAAEATVALVDAFLNPEWVPPSEYSNTPPGVP